MRFVAVILVFSAAWPAAADPAGAGAVLRGRYLRPDCGPEETPGRLWLEFVGRMPAGPSAVTVTTGNAFAELGCTDRLFTLRMRGDTPSGEFRWNCVAYLATYIWVAISNPNVSVFGRCNTVGRSQVFYIEVNFEGLIDRDRAFGEDWLIAGAYVASRHRMPCQFLPGGCPPGF